MATENKKMYEVVAEKLIEMLKEGTAPWQKPWNSAGTDYSMPHNAVTGKPYRGINAMSLIIFSQFQDPRFATFKQAVAQGWEIQKGAKGFLINFIKTHELKKMLDEKGKPILDENGKPKMKTQVLNSPIITKSWVFNAEQIKGIPPMPVIEVSEKELWEKVERAEKIVANSGVQVDHKAGDRAFYSPLYDKIQMPERKQFDTADRYYSTLLHELGHSTGHHSRLNREMVGKFGTEEYAREELRAEISSMMVGAELKIGHDPSQHVAYVKSWIQILQDTPFEIQAACADAQRITDYVLAYEQKIDIKKEVEETTKNHQATLVKGDEISYKSNNYLVLSADKNEFVIEDKASKHKIQLKDTDALYSSLVTAKLSPTKAEIREIESKRNNANVQANLFEPAQTFKRKF